MLHTAFWRSHQAADIERIFTDVGKGKNDFITSADFVDLFSDFIVGDVGMHDISRGSSIPKKKKGQQ